MWRPKDWDNPHKDDGLDSCPDCSAVYEAGADAMLEALKKMGERWADGVEVFIPDEV